MSPAELADIWRWVGTAFAFLWRFAFPYFLVTPPPTFFCPPPFPSKSVRSSVCSVRHLLPIIPSFHQRRTDQRRGGEGRGRRTTNGNKEGSEKQKKGGGRVKKMGQQKGGGVRRRLNLLPPPLLVVVVVPYLRKWWDNTRRRDGKGRGISLISKKSNLEICRRKHFACWVVS